MLKISSDNPDFSYILSKHPENVYTRKLRGGVIHGAYTTDKKSFILMLDDDPNRPSFPINEKRCMLDVSDTSSPMLASQIIKSSMRSAYMYSELDVPGYTNSVTIPCLHVNKTNMLKSIVRIFENKMVTCKATQLGDSPSLFEVTFESTQGLHYVLKAVMLTMLCISGKNEARVGKIKDDFMVFYSGIMNELDLGYYLRYMFAKSFLLGDEAFKNNSHHLEREGIELNFGNSQYQRWSYVNNNVARDIPIVDIGCGEGFNTLRLAAKTPHTVYAYDVDEECRDIVAAKAKARGHDVVVFDSNKELIRSSALSSFPCNVILMEVIEHMEKETAANLITDILDNLNVTTLHISTPNREFNAQYMMEDGEFRHDDHEWEASYTELTDFIQVVMEELNRRGIHDYTATYVNYGDSVDGVSATHYFKFERVVAKPMAIVTVGASASGKSTFVKHLDGDWSDVNRDEVRFGGPHKDWRGYNFTKGNEDAVTNKVNRKINGLMKRKKNIIVSDTNLNPIRRSDLVNKLKEARYEVLVKHFDVDLETLIGNRDHGSGGIPTEALVRQWVTHQRELQGIIRYIPQHDKVGYIIDIDGTFFDVDWRDPFDYSLMPKDPVFKHVAMLVKSMLDMYDPTVDIVFMSGRKTAFAEETKRLVFEYLGLDEGNDDIKWYFREDEDNRKDHIIKREFFEHLTSHNDNCIDWLAIDDRPQTVEQCWTLLGVPVWDVKPKTKERF